MELKANAALKQLMKDYFKDLDEAGRDPQQKVAWCTSVGPAELLRAFGYKVYFPENHGALLGVTRQAVESIPHATALGYSSKICSYLTSDIGSYLKKQTPLTKAYGLEAPPKPDLLVASDNQCREVEEWFGFYGREYDVPVMVVRSPKFLDTLEDRHLAYVTHEMQALIGNIEDLLGVKLDQDKLRQAVDLSARATNFWKKVLNTARAKPAPLTFFDGTIHMGPIVLMRGTQACLDYYETLYAELKTCQANGLAAIPGERHRLYWDGMPVWGKLRRLADVFADFSTCVVASTYCNSWVFDAFDKDDPVASVARAYAEIFINRSERKKQDYLVDICQDFKVDGIIYHDAMTCPYNSNSHFGLPERVWEKNRLPYVVLDGDLNDLRCFSEEQSIIKIETFIEQLAQ